MRIIKFILLVFTLLLSSCSTESTKVESVVEMKTKKDTTIKYAKRFSVSKYENIKVIHVFGNDNLNDTTLSIVLFSGNSKPDLKLKNICFVKTPCKRIASLSSIYTAMLCELGCVNSIVAIDNADYYNNIEVVGRVKQRTVLELQKDPELNNELAVSLNPDVIFSFGMPNAGINENKKLKLSDIPFVSCLDHLEETPLARAEWIKFFALFVNKEMYADSIFNVVCRNYEALKNKASVTKNKPTVLSELKYGDTWYVPGGNSYMAKLINDANAQYLWNDVKQTGSIPLSFEAVYKKASEADFWINVSMCDTRQQMLQQDKRYADFKAFKEEHVFNNNLYKNQLNYSTYWETGMIYPDRILSDLIYLFHGSESNYDKTYLYYYKKVK